MRLLGSTIPPADELEAAYRKSDAERRRYHNLFEFAGAACLVTDLGGRIREANQAAAGLLRVRGRCLIGADLIGLVAEEDRARFSAQLGTVGRRSSARQSWTQRNS